DAGAADGATAADPPVLGAIDLEAVFGVLREPVNSEEEAAEDEAEEADDSAADAAVDSDTDAPGEEPAESPSGTILASEVPDSSVADERQQKWNRILANLVSFVRQKAGLMTSDEHVEYCEGVANGFVGGASDTWGLMKSIAETQLWLRAKRDQYSLNGLVRRNVESYFLKHDWHAEYLGDFQQVRDGLQSAVTTVDRVRVLLGRIGGHGGELLAASLLNDQEALARFGVQHQLIAEILGDSLLDVLEVLSESIADPKERGERAGAELYDIVEDLVSARITTAAKAGKVCAGLSKLADLADSAGDRVKSARIRRILHRFSEHLEKLGSVLKLCFVAGTPVLTPTGPRPIETLQPGDWVLSRPESCDPTQFAARPRRVLNLFETHPIELYHLTIVTADGRRERLGTTGNHPFYEASERRFVPARELRPGCRVVTVTG
ncbi:MAG: Hint domain-containing protein, partial [Planctomycetaceae bacterium]